MWHVYHDTDEYRDTLSLWIPACPVACFHNTLQAVKCLMKVHQIESSTPRRADVVGLWTHSCSNGPPQHTHTVPVQKSSSQKFKVSTELPVSLPGLYIKEIWMRVVCLQDALTLVWRYQLSVEAGERLWGKSALSDPARLWLLAWGLAKRIGR